MEEMEVRFKYQKKKKKEKKEKKTEIKFPEGRSPNGIFEEMKIDDAGEIRSFGDFRAFN